MTDNRAKIVACAIASVLVVGGLAWLGTRGSAPPISGGAEPAARVARVDPAPAPAVPPPADGNRPDALRPSPGAPALSAPAPTDADAKAEHASEPLAPSFDVVRVDPTGESVIAGRAAPGATVDLLSNGQALTRAIADASGLFAIVAPRLKPGSHEITLQTIAPDGSRARSAQSVTVVVAPDGKQAPLVTIASPDGPTVVLSHPDGPAGQGASVAANASPPVGPAPTAPDTAGAGAPAAAEAARSAAPRPEIRIGSVESESSGKLFVAGQGAPGATLRLYLNDSFVAPGAANGEGRVAFSIEKGVKPGDYKVRLDDVDPVSGQVRSRAEVGFTMPAVAGKPEPGRSPAVAEAPALRASPDRPVVASLGASPAPAAAPTVAPSSRSATRPASPGEVGAGQYAALQPDPAIV
ncbi:MAG: peptidoglycan-binding protein LysM, partial [Methylobacteriaceae bacterium]|nr:peptidoglycan-binding protein LysM [Methylobacteriaceae bacterium]